MSKKKRQVNTRNELTSVIKQCSSFSRRRFLEIALGMGVAGLTSHIPIGSSATAKTFKSPNYKRLLADISEKSVSNFIDKFEGRIVLPSDPFYDSLRRIWNFKFDNYPGMIAVCSNVADVQRAVSFSTEHELLLSVRSGGHSLAGYSSCDGGIVIITSDMHGVTVNVAKKEAEILGGTTIGLIDEELSKYGMATPGAGAATVGYAGFATGGGRGTISPNYGLACDNIKAVDIVTADGQLRKISSISDPDLFWAVRGGGGNFGVVTRFNVNIHHLPEVIGGSLVFPFKDASNIMKRIRDLLFTVPDELYVAPMLARNGEDPFLVVNLLFSGHKEHAEAVVASYRATGKVVKDSISAVKYLDTQSWFPGPPKGTATEGCSGFFPTLTDDIIEALISSAETGPSTFTIPCFSMHGALADKNFDHNAYPLREKGIDFFAMGFWRSPDDRQKTEKWARELWSSVASATRGTFVNGFFDSNLERARISYRDKYLKLANLKATYDPTNIFSQNVNIIPSI